MEKKHNVDPVFILGVVCGINAGYLYSIWLFYKILVLNFLWNEKNCIQLSIDTGYWLWVIKGKLSYQ